MLHQYSDNSLLSVSFSGYYYYVSQRRLRDCYTRGSFLLAESPRKAGGKAAKNFGGQFDFHPFFPTRPCQITLCDCFVKANIFSLAITRLRCLLRCRTDRALHRDNKVWSIASSTQFRVKYWVAYKNTVCVQNWTYDVTAKRGYTNQKTKRSVYQKLPHTRKTTCTKVCPFPGKPLIQGLCLFFRGVFKHFLFKSFSSSPEI